MTTEQNKTVARRTFEEVWNKGNLAVIDETSAPNLVNHFTPPGMPAGREGFKQFAKAYRAGFPDLHFVLFRAYAGARSVVLHYQSVQGLVAAECMELDEDGRIRRVQAHYALGPDPAAA